MKNTIRSYGPGKFNTILDSYVYGVSLDGGTDAECGSVDELGWYGLMRNGRTIFKDHDPNLEPLNDAEKKLLTESAGVILSEDSNGFVYVQYFETTMELNAAWSKIESEYKTEQELEADAE